MRILDLFSLKGKIGYVTGADVFLASKASSFITDHNLVVDGGYTLW